ncbi:aminotransferase class III-fold pyridoxal phosphate-dependent enzyme, partial [Pseudomonas syringae]
PAGAAACRAIVASPAARRVLDWAAPACTDAAQGLARRDASFPRSQKHCYQAPPQIARGWRNHLVDMQGRSYLDMLHNVAVLGHGHPRMAHEAARPWSLPYTQSRFYYALLADCSERLLTPAPEGIDPVVLVNIRTEAHDLALTRACAYRRAC